MTDSVKPKSAAGGKRPGAGRPAKSAGDVYQELAAQRARHERAKADARETENRRRCGQLLERQQVELAAMKLHSTMAQWLRSLPDDLERKCGLPPATVEALERAIDGATVELAGRLNDALKADCPA